MNVRNQPISQDILLTLLEGQKRLEGEMAALKELVAEKDRIIADCKKYADSYKEAGIKNDESRAFFGIYNSFHISAMILANEDKIVEHCLNVAEN